MSKFTLIVCKTFYCLTTQKTSPILLFWPCRTKSLGSVDHVTALVNGSRLSHSLHGCLHDECQLLFGSKLLQDVRTWIIIWYIIIALLLTLPLWAMSLYLRFRAHHRIEYCYFLPQDADLVRLHQCIFGMQLAVMSLPNTIKEDLLDPLIRAVQVSSRTEAFPAGKRSRVAFTNNFSVYCNLAVHASTQGYYHLLEIYTDKCALYEELADLLKAYPEVDDVAKNRLHMIAKQITGDTDKQDEEQES